MPNGSTPNEGTGPSNPQGDLIELKVKNAISAEVETYRTTMENYYKRFETAVKWIASAFVALAGAAVALFYFFVGPNIKEAKEEVPQLLKQQVNQLVIQMEVEKTAIQEISNNIRDFTAGAIASASNEINASVMVLLRGEVHTELGKFPTKELTNLLRSVPIGTIATYGGTNITPESGWLVCNGREVQRAVYSNLFDAISNTWGSGNGSNTFNLPNLQGMFLRGVDTNGTVDPDCQTRVNSQGQPVGAVVGSFQEDAFQGHYHEVWKYNYGDGPRSGQARVAGEAVSIHPGRDQNFLGQIVKSAIDDGANGPPRIGKETRPKNAYVYYIIKY